MLEETYRVQDAPEIPSPSLIYYKDIITENTKKAIALAGGSQRLWPHVKTHKCAQMIRLQMELGIVRFKCATIAEAEMVAREKAQALLLAFPLVGPNIGRYLRLAKDFPDTAFYAIGDDYGQLEQLAAAARAAGQEMDVLLDVNMGMNRTGVVLEKAQALYERCARLKGISMKGLHCYDGHNNASDYAAREAAVLAADKQVEAILAALEEKGIPCEILIMGGTPSFPCHARHTTWYLSPGTLFVSDMGYRNNLPDLDFVPGAAVLTRVVSHPAQGLFTLDLGYKGIASDPAGSRGAIVGLDGAKPLFQSEEHWVFQMEEGREPPAIGTVLYVVPTHICPTSALYPAVLVAQNGKVVDTWEITARNRRLEY